MNKDINSKSIKESELNEVSAGRNVNTPSEDRMSEIISGRRNSDGRTMEEENIPAPVVLKMPKMK